MQKESDKFNMAIISPNSAANQTKKIKKGLEDSGRCATLKIMAFEREEASFSQTDCISLGKIKRGKYLSRILNLKNAIKIIAENLKSADLAYTWTLDCLIVTILAKFFSGNRKLKIIYNVRDIHKALTKPTIKSALLRRLDKFASRFVDLFVVTSPLYISKYYNEKLGLKNLKCIALENKVQEELWQKIPRPAEESADRENIVIGYFGLMSYKRSWEVIKNILKISDNIFFYMRGHNYLGEYFQNEQAQFENLKYEGAYRNPEDMEEMFGQIDVSWAVNAENYTPDTNDQWAMCNRFYEALYFKKPLIVQEGSAHSGFVAKHDIGICVDIRDINSATAKILSITKQDIARWKKNIDRIEASVFKMEEKEYSKIFDAFSASDETPLN